MISRSRSKTASEVRQIKYMRRLADKGFIEHIEIGVVKNFLEDLRLIGIITISGNRVEITESGKEWVKLNKYR